MVSKLWVAREDGLKTISEVWESREESVWLKALQNYWSNKSVLRDIELERRLSKLNPAEVKTFDEREWYNFLMDEYFPWKFRGTYLPRRQEDLKKYERTSRLSNLLCFRDRIFACDLSRLSGVAEALRIADGINGLGPAGASGLLALLFPKWAGTADQNVVKASCGIESLPERPKLLAIKNPACLTVDEAVLLIDIMRWKASELNRLFKTDLWVPRYIDMILFDYGNNHGEKSRC